MAEADPVTTPASGLEQIRHRLALRKRLFTILALVVLVAGLLYLLWDWLIGSRYVSTDNAYVGGDVAQVTPLIAGQVAAVAVSDTQPVRRGQVLVRLSDDDARVALDRARAEYDLARRAFTGTRATGEGLRSMVAAREAEIASAQSRLLAARSAAHKAKVDYDRRNALARTGAVSGDELTAAADALAAANAALDLAQAQLGETRARQQSAREDFNANQAMTGNLSIDASPEVRAARARLAAVELDMARTVIRAPLDGIVTRRQVQVGQRVERGETLMTIVPVEHLYVDANFKENQLAHVRIGQKVHLVSLLYGDDVDYEGTVVGVSGGTGAAFALIPAQNATGNWIRITQRLPVRIALDPAQLREHPLRIGLSMEARISLDR